MSFVVTEVDNPELVTTTKGTSTGAAVTSENIDANTEALHVDGSKVTQPVSAASLPLPAGAATEATLATLSTEAKLEAVRALLATIDADTSALALVDYATQTTLEAARVLLASLDGKDFATQTTLLAADGRLATIDAVLDSIKDVDGIKKITDPLPAGTNLIGKETIQSGTKGTAVAADITSDPIDANKEALHVAAIIQDEAGASVNTLNDAGVVRLEINGKVVVTGATPPPATTAAIIFADTPLTVGTHDTTFVIPDGESFTLQEIVAGNEDPTKGSSVECIYDNGTEHLIERIYRVGSTSATGYPDRNTARDGTACVGNAGGTFVIVVRRVKYTGSDIAIDAVVRGYTS